LYGFCYAVKIILTASRYPLKFHQRIKWMTQNELGLNLQFYFTMFKICHVICKKFDFFIKLMKYWGQRVWILGWIKHTLHCVSFSKVFSLPWNECRSINSHTLYFSYSFEWGGVEKRKRVDGWLNKSESKPNTSTLSLSILCKKETYNK
jgi:hypothetical protein